MNQLLYTKNLFETVQIGSKLKVKVSIQTKPNSELLNSAILGMIGLSIGCVSNLVNLNNLKGSMIMSYNSYNSVYRNIIRPSISDAGSTRILQENGKFSVLYGNCNNVIRVLPMLSKISGIEFTNISVTAEVLPTKQN